MSLGDKQELGEQGLMPIATETSFEDDRKSYNALIN